LLRELVMATISDQPDVEIVGKFQREAEFEHAVEETHPGFLQPIELRIPAGAFCGGGASGEWPAFLGATRSGRQRRRCGKHSICWFIGLKGENLFFAVLRTQRDRANGAGGASPATQKKLSSRLPSAVSCIPRL
jgi:hypothetical protein